MVSRAVKLRDGAALEKSELLPSADCGSPGRRGPGKSVHCSDSPSLIHTPPVETPKSDRPEIHTDAFLHRMMRRQLHLSIACAATFLLALLGLPLLNYFRSGNPKVRPTRDSYRRISPPHDAAATAPFHRLRRHLSAGPPGSAAAELLQIWKPQSPTDPRFIPTHFSTA